MKGILNSPEVDKLKTIIEEATRSSQEGVKRFVEPTDGALDRATLRRHHIVFGRRGSGKSSLLRKAAAKLTIDRRPIAYIDLETFKGHSYPDVLLSILIHTFGEYEQWLQTVAINPANKTSFWQRRFGAPPSRPAFNREKAQTLASQLRQQIQTLEEQLYSQDGSTIRRTTKQGLEAAGGSESSLRVGNGQIGVVLGSSEAVKSSVGEEVHETFAKSKVDFMLRHIMQYQQLFRQLADLTSGDAFLFLDDLYHIRQDDQTRVLDYFHRLAKGNNLWLKVGTIRHRSRWYLHGDPPTGVKLGDDAEEIDLDLTLERFKLAKDFLTEILKGFLEESGNLSTGDVLVDDAMVRLVLASGGVARDFLGIFRRSIEVARERGPKQRGDKTMGEKITTEDINNAAGEYDNSKREELARDTTDERDQLEVTLENIRQFCFSRSNANVFLLDKDLPESSTRDIHELVDLRLLHRIKSRVTVWDREGKLYEAYMLDISQYTGSRKKRDLKIIEFWRENRDTDESGKRTEDALRRPGLIYDPSQSYGTSPSTSPKPKKESGVKSPVELPTGVKQPPLL